MMYKFTVWNCKLIQLTLLRMGQWPREQPERYSASPEHLFAPIV